MKYLRNLYAFVIASGLGLGVIPLSVYAQDSLAKSVGLFVYPKAGQSSAQQSKDDMECYSWAKEQTGYDPINPSQPQAAAVNSGPDGSRARGAVRGAMAGAVVDEYREDHIGGGAQINERYGDDDSAREAGAAIGAVRGGARSRQSRRHAQQQAEQQAAAASGAQLDSFKKAYGVCLTARDYTVQ